MSAKLIFTNPCNRLTAVVKIHFIDIVPDFGMIADKLVTNVTVHNNAVSNNDGTDEPPLG